MLNEHSLNKSLLRFALIAMTLLIAIVLGLLLRWVLVQLFVAIIIAAGMAPLVSALTHPERTRNWRWRPPRALVVLVIYALACFIVLAGAALLIRVLTLEGQVLVDRVPEYANAAQAWIDAQGQTNPFLQALGLGSFSIGLVGLEQYVLTVLRQLAGAATLLFSLFGGAVTVLFVLFMACIAVGIGARIGLAIIGVPGAVVLGVIWAVAELIPGIGPFISALPTIILGFAAGPTTGLLAALFSLVWSQVANNVMLPRIMSRAVKLNPLVVLLSLLVGHELLGVLGALISMPVAAACAVVVDEFRIERLTSRQARAPSTTVAAK